MVAAVKIDPHDKQFSESSRTISATIDTGAEAHVGGDMSLFSSGLSPVSGTVLRAAFGGESDVQVAQGGLVHMIIPTDCGHVATRLFVHYVASCPHALLISEPLLRRTLADANWLIGKESVRGEWVLEGNDGGAQTLISTDTSNPNKVQVNVVTSDVFLINTATVEAAHLHSVFHVLSVKCVTI